MSVAGESGLVFLDPALLRFHFRGAALCLDNAGKTAERVRLLRAAPLSMPGGYISVRDRDGKEIGVLRDLSALDRDSREAAQSELYRRYIVPEIRKILGGRKRFDSVELDLDTDRGRRRIATREPLHQAVEVHPGRLLIEDAEDNRYEIRDVSALDPASRKILAENM